MTTIEKLDALLNIFETDNSDRGINRIKIRELLGDQGNQISDKLLIEMLVKLERDGFLRHELDRATIGAMVVKDVPYYLLTVEGNLFKIEGGYAQEMCRREKEALLDKKLKNTTIDANVSVTVVNRFFYATLVIAGVSAMTSILTFIVELKKDKATQSSIQQLNKKDTIGSALRRPNSL